jgi:hypothetical protein
MIRKFCLNKLHKISAVKFGKINDKKLLIQDVTSGYMFRWTKFAHMRDFHEARKQKSKSVCLSDHARLRCIERGVSARKILQCLKRRRVYFRGRSQGHPGQVMKYQLEIPGQGHTPRFLSVVASKKSTTILTTYWSNTREMCEKDVFRRRRNNKRKAAMKQSLFCPQSLTKGKRFPKAPRAMPPRSCWHLKASPLPPPPMRCCKLEIKNYATASSAKWSIITLPVDPSSLHLSEPAAWPLPRPALMRSAGMESAQADARIRDQASPPHSRASLWHTRNGTGLDAIKRSLVAGNIFASLEGGNEDESNCESKVLRGIGNFLIVNIDFTCIEECRARADDHSRYAAGNIQANEQLRAREQAKEEKQAIIRAEEERLEWALARVGLRETVNLKAKEQQQAAAMAGKPRGAKTKVNSAKLSLELSARLDAALRSRSSEDNTTKVKPVTAGRVRREDPSKAAERCYTGEEALPLGVVGPVTQPPAAANAAKRSVEAAGHDTGSRGAAGRREVACKSEAA